MKYFTTYLKLRRKRTAPIRRERHSWQWWYACVGNSMVTRVLAMAFLVVSALGYISASSALSTKGYEMKEVERDISALREEVQHLQIFIAQHRSLARVQSRIPSLGLVPLDTISYVDIRTGASFAQR